MLKLIKVGERLINIKKNKMTIEEIEKKKKYHQKRVNFYNKKLEEKEKNKNIVKGFIRYD